MEIFEQRKESINQRLKKAIELLNEGLVLVGKSTTNAELDRACTDNGRKLEDFFNGRDLDVLFNMNYVDDFFKQIAKNVVDEFAEKLNKRN